MKKLTLFFTALSLIGILGKPVWIHGDYTVFMDKVILLSMIFNLLIMFFLSKLYNNNYTASGILCVSIMSLVFICSTIEYAEHPDSYSWRLNGIFHLSNKIENYLSVVFVPLHLLAGLGVMVTQAWLLVAMFFKLFPFGRYFHKSRICN